MPAESHLLAGFGLEPGVGKQELVLEIEIPEEAAVQSSQLLIKTMLNVFLMSIVCRKNEKNSRPKFIPAGGLVADGVRSWRTHAASYTLCSRKLPNNLHLNLAKCKLVLYNTDTDIFFSAGSKVPKATSVVYLGTLIESKGRPGHEAPKKIQDARQISGSEKTLASV